MVYIHVPSSTSSKPIIISFIGNKIPIALLSAQILNIYFMNAVASSLILCEGLVTVAPSKLQNDSVMNINWSADMMVEKWHDFKNALINISDKCAPMETRRFGK